MSIPLVALQGVVPPPQESPVETYGKVLQIKSLQMQQQAQQLQLEEAKRQQQDQETFRQAFMEAGGDFSKAIQLATSRGVSPTTTEKLLQAHAERVRNVALATETELKNMGASIDVTARSLKAVKDSPVEFRPKIYAQQRYALGQAGVDVSQLPPTYPGDDHLPIFDASIGMSSALLKEGLDARRAAAGEKQAQTAEQRLTVETPGITAKGEISAQQAAMTPEEREMLSATETSLATLAAKGNQTAKRALTLLQQSKAATAGAEAAAKMRGEMSAMAGIAGGTALGASAVTPGQVNEGFLKGLSPAISNQIKALAEGRMQFAGSFALRSPYWQNMIALVSQYDPSFDATQWAVRTQVRQDFTKGKAAANIRSLNTAIGHLDSLKTAAAGLENASMPLWNRIANYGFTQAGDPRVVRFNTAANAVAGEAATVFKGTSGTDQEIRTWHDQLNASQSPAQMNASINQIIELLASRMDALDSQWQTGMKRARDFRLLNDKSVGILKKMGKKDVVDRDLTTSPAATSTSTTMVPGAAPRGLIESGNIDITRRPSVPNPQTGGRSSVWSMSVGTDKGEVLIPRVSDDGRILTEEQAVEQYKRTGHHLGIFDTPENATAYARSLHEDQASRLPGTKSIQTADDYLNKLRGQQ